MPIGYAPFSTIEQANNQTVNQLVGLGQQIGNAIETHAATQSAQAMLPMLQQQYQTGMAKIADGKPEGLSDIYSASIVASQNPLLAPMANHAIATAQSANINAQHMARTQAYLGGRMASLYGQYGSGLMQAPEGMNPTWQGKQTQQRGFTPYQQTQAQVNQAKTFSNLYQGKPDTAKGPGEPGIGPLADKINTAINNGEAPDPTDIRNFASKYNEYKQLQSAYGQNAITHPEIESAFNQIQSQIIPKMGNLVNEESKKGAGGWFGYGHADKSKIQSLNQGIQQLQGLGGLPSVSGSMGGNIGDQIIKLPTGKSIKASSYMQAIKDLQANPSTKDIFDSHFGKGAADQILKGSQSSANTGEENEMANEGETSSENDEEMSS